MSATEVILPSAVADVAKSFSLKYCSEVSNIGDPEKAAEIASRQMISGLIFSGVLKEVMAVPKEEMALFISTEIFNICGNDLFISQSDLNSYLLELADSGQKQNTPQAFKPFGVG